MPLHALRGPFSSESPTGKRSQQMREFHVSQTKGRSNSFLAPDRIDLTQHTPRTSPLLFFLLPCVGLAKSAELAST